MRFGSLALRSPVPIRVVDEGVGRSPAVIEAAIYFCVREAIQNAAKHAGAGAHRDRDAGAASATPSSSRSVDDGAGIAR